MDRKDVAKLFVLIWLALVLQIFYTKKFFHFFSFFSFHFDRIMAFHLNVFSVSFSKFTDFLCSNLLTMKYIAYI